MNNDFRRAVASIQNELKEFSINMKKLKPVFERFEKNLKPLEEKLIKSGWTINMNMMPYHINEISELIQEDEIDSYFYNYYMENNQERLKLLKSRSLHNLDTNLVKAFEESIFAYENHKYIICVNTLVTIIEGTLSNIGNDKNSIHMIKICREQLSNCPEGETSLNRIMWNINLKFVEELYKKYKFSESEPFFINRHWLMHGRSSFDIKEIDCLRLLNAIGTLCHIKKEKSKID